MRETVIGKRYWVLLVLALVCGVAVGWILGTSTMTRPSARRTPKPPDIEVDEIFLRDYTKAFEPSLTVLDQAIAGLTIQNKWLRDHLVKCIEKLEAQQGISPEKKQKISPLFEHPGMGPYSQYDTIPDVNSRRSYDRPELISEKLKLEREIKKQICLMNLRAISYAVLQYTNEMSMAELDARLAKVIDSNQP